MTSPGGRLTAAALAGAATGARTFTGLAGLTLATSADAPAQPDRSLAKPAVKAVITLAAVQEWVMDKLPQTPSRLEPFGLAVRGVAAAACGVIAARRVRPEPVDPGAPVDSAPGEPDEPPAPSWLPVATVGTALGAAAATAYLGATGRGRCADLVGRDWIGAAVEDLAALGFAAAAAAALAR